MEGTSYKVCSGVKRPVTYVTYYMRKLILLHNFYPPHQNISLSAEFHHFPVSVCAGSHLGGSSLVKGNCGVTSDGAVFPKGSSQGFVLPNSTNLTGTWSLFPQFLTFHVLCFPFLFLGGTRVGRGVRNTNSPMSETDSGTGVSLSVLFSQQCSCTRYTVSAMNIENRHTLNNL